MASLKKRNRNESIGSVNKQLKEEKARGKDTTRKVATVSAQDKFLKEMSQKTAAIKANPNGVRLINREIYRDIFCSLPTICRINHKNYKKKTLLPGI